MADRRETKYLKPIDKAIPGMVSKSPGRNESERTGSLEKYKPWRSRALVQFEGNRISRRLAETVNPSGGVGATVRQQGHTEQLEKPSSSQGEITGAR